MYNKSQSPWLICYHAPKLMVERYGFNVELLVQTQTSMYGSGENHMGYLYKRIKGIDNNPTKINKCPSGGDGLPIDIPCDPLFAIAWRTTKGEFHKYADQVQAKLNSVISNKGTRNSKRLKDVFSLIKKTTNDRHKALEFTKIDESSSTVEKKNYETNNKIDETTGTVAKKTFKTKKNNQNQTTQAEKKEKSILTIVRLGIRGSPRYSQASKSLVKSQV